MKMEHQPRLARELLPHAPGVISGVLELLAAIVVLGVIAGLWVDPRHLPKIHQLALSILLLALILTGLFAWAALLPFAPLG